MKLIEQTDIDAIVHGLRLFYKFGRKSVNKFFNVHPALLAHHKRRLESTSHAAAAELKALRENFHDDNYEAYGEYLLGAKHTLGNCLENCAVALCLIKQNGELMGKVKKLAVAYTHGRRNHCIVMLCDESATWPPPIECLDDIERVGSLAGIWVIDYWAKTACPLSQYRQKVREKGTTWLDQYKWISFPKKEPDGRPPKASDIGAMPADEFFEHIGIQHLDYAYF